MSINGTFRFHPVGQGLFYSGILNGGRGGAFSFVYDCGTRSDRRFLQREIDDLKPLLPRSGEGRRRLDLLVVSHMHDDHVSGLARLLEGVDVGTVVMPYADQATRLLARLESSGDEAFLSLFYDDPVDWLSSRGVRRVALVGSPEEGRPNDMRLYPESEIDALRFDGQSVLSAERSGQTTLLHLGNHASARVRPCRWEFQFRNLRLPRWESYRKVVKAYQREVLLPLDDVFRSKKRSGELARRLREAMGPGKTVNRTSVVATHGPIDRDGVTTSFWPSGNPLLGDRHWKGDLNGCEHARRYCRRTILTGDVELRDGDADSGLWDDDVEFVVFQYPHHGARNALSGKSLGMHWLTVFSSGISNRYGHPNPIVVEKQRLPVFVDERNAFDYRISVDEW